MATQAEGRMTQGARAAEDPEQKALNKELILAAERGQTKAVLRHIEAGAELDARDGDGWNALMYASRGRLKDVVNALIAAGAPLDSQDASGTTALMYATALGFLPITRALIAAGASPRVADEHGRTALHYAALRGQTGVVAALIEAGADVEAKDNDQRTPLDLARKDCALMLREAAEAERARRIAEPVKTGIDWAALA